jgi:membrane protein implicated in regulation of membrane protease activity
MAAIVGLPLVAYAVFFGDGDGEVGEMDSADGGIVSYFSLGTFSFFAGFFGLTGLATSLTGTGAALSLVLAAIVGLTAAFAHRTLLKLVKTGASSSHVRDVDFSGRTGIVVVPIESGKRGRIALDIGDQRQYLTAQLSSGEPAALDVGSPIVIIEVDQSIALVGHLDPELA